ncbi:hypothetical protein EJ06DRAFT_490689 [Trichodelitschia bisporula]|uniref:Ribosome quality control complex subunit 2 n=1 Tax=Trichodelitschia bisporula TaxID=703511 RepID=A0A6G1I231_9PEZI|nr:hypothetical protein EJ06DRAFT_490689 [Trichodelitschia bisporula]
MKQRFSSLDVKVIAHELNAQLTSLRVSNIYDLSTRIFLFKFQKPDHKEQLVVESGFRCHLSSFVRTVADAPSAFVTRLRKALRTRRVTKVSQIGTDRIIELEFSEGTYRLFLEFYAAGNIVLTDNELNIIALLRNVDEGSEHERLRVGLKYNLSMRQNFAGVPPLTKERIRDGIQKALARQQGTESTGKKARQKGKDALRKSLAVSINEFPPMLIDHAMHAGGFDPTTPPEKVLENTELLDKLLGALEEAQKVVSHITQADLAQGYIFCKRREDAPGDAKDDTTESKLIYDDFHPFLPKQYADNPDLTTLAFEGFNKTVDEFFSSIEGQKLESRLNEREETARKRLEAARLEHQKRLGGLQEVQALNIQKAEAIQANVERVQEATAAVNGLIAQGMDWVDIGRLIEVEQKRNNPVAQTVKLPLKLYINTVTLWLSKAEVIEDDDASAALESETESEDSDVEEPPETVSQKGKQKSKGAQETRLAVDIDLALSPWANASQYYDQKKSAAEKEDKTLKASTKALKSVEQKIVTDLKKGLTQEKDVLRPVRKQYWFEKFHYFISSDGYLVIGGRDAQQNEILYRRYLKKGDAYVHADLSGASSVIIKNNPSTPEAPIPPSTLSQAGTLSVATSNAWDSKAVMSAWWVNSDQVSKTAPTGEYLTTGGFMIRGKKNFLPPAQLLLGFAIMFQVSEESKLQHKRHRIDYSGANAGEDRKAPVAAPDNEDESSSDESFPDADPMRYDSDSEGDDGTSHKANPLQSLTSASAPQGKDSKKDEEDGPESDEDSDKEEEEEKAKEGEEEAKAEEDGDQEEENLAEVEEENDAEEPVSKTHPTGSKPSPPDQPPSITSTPQAKSKPLPRGKRGKQKKIAAKYGWQDEEEREQALQLLGSKSGQERAAAKEVAMKAKKQQEEESKKRRRELHLKTQTVGLALEQARKAALEGPSASATANAEDEHTEADDETTRLELLGLDAFVGTPLPGDEIICAIAVCAPWTALNSFKYRAKMQPGSTKKGKAVKEILSRWQTDAKDAKLVDSKSEDPDKMWPREAELIRGLKDVEVFNVVPVRSVRVMMAGKSGKSGMSMSVSKGKGTKSARGGRGSKKKK